MSRCSLPCCRERAAVQLWAVDGAFWFCLAHAAEYRLLGYRDEKWAA